MRIFKQKLFVLSAFLLALTITTDQSETLAQQKPNSRIQPSTNIYPDDVVKNYMDTCVANASSVLGEGSATDMCACTIAELEKKYSPEEFVEMANNLQSGEVPDSITEIATTCLTRIEKKSLH